MPEAVELIKRCRDEKVERLEMLCASCAEDDDCYLDSDACDMCIAEQLKKDIAAIDVFLAKLEGGAEDERD